MPFVQNGNSNIVQVGYPINIIYGNSFVGVNSTKGNPVYQKSDGSLVQLNRTGLLGTIGGYDDASGKDDPV